MNKEELRKELITLCAEASSNTDKREDSMEKLIEINVKSIKDHELLDMIGEIMLEEEVVFNVMSEIQKTTCLLILADMFR